MTKEFRFKVTIDGGQPGKEIQTILDGLEDIGDQAQESFGAMEDAMSDAVDELRAISGLLEKTKRSGQDAFGGVGDSVSKSIVNLQRFREFADNILVSLFNIGKQGVSIFAEITKGGVELAAQAELTQISLANIFSGNERAAKAFASLVSETADKIGFDRGELTSLAKGILPDVGSIQQTVDLLENVAILGVDAQQSVVSVRLALEESLSGNLSSLQRRLNIPESTIKKVEEYAQNMSLAEALTKALAERVKETGLSADSTAGSLSTLLGQLRGEVTTLHTILGTAPSEELKEVITGVLESFGRNRDDIENVAEAIGDVAAKIIEVIGEGATSLFDNIDYDQIQDLATNMQDLLDTTRLFAEALGGAEIADDLISSVNWLVESLEDAALSASRIISDDRAKEARRLAENEVLLAALPEGPRKDRFDITAPLAGLELRRFASEELIAEAEIAGQKAYNDELRGYIKLEEERNKRIEENQQKEEERKKATEESSEADLRAADALIQYQKALEAADEAAVAATEARVSIEEKRTKAIGQLEDELAEIRKRNAQRLIDDEIKNSQRREDIARRNLNRIADIERRNRLAVDRQGTGLDRKEADIARKDAREKIKIERDSAREKIRVEQDTTRKLQDLKRDARRREAEIDREFFRSARQAERANDVQAFVDAEERRREALEDNTTKLGESIKDAKSQRDQEIKDVKEAADKQREIRAERLQQEIEDAKIANTRKLEDLAARLDQELEAQQIANTRAIEEQQIAEARLVERREIEHQRELETFADKEQRRIAKLEESIAQELQVIKDAEIAKRELVVAEAEKTLAAVTAVYDKVPKLSGGLSSFLPRNRRDKDGDVPLVALTGSPFRRQEGSGVNAGDMFLAGEAGPELYMARKSGFILPNRIFQQFGPRPVMPLPISMGRTSTVSNDHSRRLSIENLNFGEGMSPVEQRSLENLVREAVQRILSGL